MKFSKNVLNSACLLLFAAGASAGPVSQYYLTAGDQGTNWVVQGSGVVNTWRQQHPANLGEYAIAVTSTVKTLGNGNCNGTGCGLGSQYTLGGTYTGTDYPYPPVTGSFYDSASDGVNNFLVDLRQVGTVWETNGSYANPVRLFDIGAGFLGITFDQIDNTLWISQFSGNAVRHYTLGGSLLGSFNVAGLSTLTSLALDPADRTLWMGSQGTEGTFYQYSRAGALLSTQTYAALQSQNTLGGEFRVTAAVPEPATLALLGLGLAGLGVSRRRKLK